MCFTMAWLMQVLVLIVIAVATYVILIQILLPYVVSKLGGGEVSQGVSVLIAVLRVVVWAIVAIIVIYVVFALLACLWSFAGGGLPSIFPRR